MKTKAIPVPDNWQELEPHPLSMLVEFNAGIDIPALGAHMRQHGYDPEESIITYEGKILDGRHKKFGAIEGGVTPTFREYVGNDPAAYVAKKLHRQHLNASQRAMFVSRLATIPEGNPALTPQICGVGLTAEKAANLVNVSTRSVENAKVVSKEGSEQLQQAVKDGKVSVSAAAKVIQKPAIFCRPCRVGGPKKNCPECAKLRGDKPKKPSAPPPKPKVGSPIFDDRPIEELIGKLARIFESRRKAYGGTSTKAYKDCYHAMEALLAAWKRWHLDTTGKK